MKIRRYYGFDCDSFNGFNNGQYVDDDFIEVSNESEAYEACAQALRDRYWFADKALSEIDGGFEIVTGWYDDDGNSITQEHFNELNETKECGHWSYVYVTFEVINDKQDSA